MAALDKLSIDTPEQVALDFSLATVGSRFLALAIDTVIQAGAGFALFFLAGLVGLLSQLAWAGLRPWGFAVLFLAWFLVYYAYFAVFETIWNGQTPGKRVIGVRVISVSGRPITAYEAILRNVVRIADQLPGIYAVGILAVFLTERSQRLGDLAANTVVVHDRAVERGALDINVTATALTTRYGAARLASEEVAVIELFFRRRSDLGGYERARAALHIAERIRRRLGITTRGDDEGLLEEVMAEYRASHRYR